MGISSSKNKRFFCKVEEYPIHNRAKVIIPRSEKGTLYSGSQNITHKGYAVGIFYFYNSRKLLAIQVGKGILPVVRDDIYSIVVIDNKGKSLFGKGLEGINQNLIWDNDTCSICTFYFYYSFDSGFKVRGWYSQFIFR